VLRTLLEKGELSLSDLARHTGMGVPMLVARDVFQAEHSHSATYI